MGIARLNKNPFATPCKHINAFWEAEPRMNLSVLEHFGRVTKGACTICGKKFLYKTKSSGRKRVYCSSACKSKAYRLKVKSKEGGDVEW
jgi:hypothetical protein